MGNCFAICSKHAVFKMHSLVKFGPMIKHLAVPN